MFCAHVGRTLYLFVMTISEEGSHQNSYKRRVSSLDELRDVIEDTVEYYCDKEQVSGEIAWIAIECLAIAKQKELNGELSYQCP